MLELFGYTTGNSFRAAIALAESGLPFRTQRVDLHQGEHRGSEYRRINPTGRVPALIDPDGPSGEPLVLTQSNAILLYAAERSGALLPADGAERARAFEWLFFFVTDVIVPNHQAFYLRKFDVPGIEEAAQKIDARAFALYEHVDRQLAGQRFLAGDRFSLADIAGYTITAFLRSHVDPSLGHVSRWLEEVAARPGVKRGMTAFD
jgi:GSH-dependent disulfide-bond oxidoreductase